MMSARLAEAAGDEKSLEEGAEGQYQLIHTSGHDGTQEPARTTSRASASRRSVSSMSSVAHVRSQNGHGCAELEERKWVSDGLPSEIRAEPGKDPFEVSWDSEDEPLCPRSMPLVRKWALVLIIGMGSLCV